MLLDMEVCTALNTLGGLGERKIIELIQEKLEGMPDMPIPFGDDVAAYPMADNQLAILKTDMLVGKTDVPPRMSLWQAARKAVVMNVSDFAAKGVRPLAVLVSLGLPKGLTQKSVEEIGRGLNAGAREYGTYVIGGDTGEASDLIISLSVFGLAKKGDVILRSGTRPGDLLAITGLFGKTAAGLKILVEGYHIQPGIRQVLVQSVLMPRARLKEGLVLNSTKAVTAAIDSSDGLAWSLHEMARENELGFVIDNVPIAEEAEQFAGINKLDPLELAFHGGEEYELVLTIKPELLERAKKAVVKVDGNLLIIGKAVKKRGILLETKGKRCVVEPRGYEHFKDVKV
jgi:thiamine-monophosphate kinase